MGARDRHAFEAAAHEGERLPAWPRAPAPPPWKATAQPGGGCARGIPTLDPRSCCQPRSHGRNHFVLVALR